MVVKIRKGGKATCVVTQTFSAVYHKTSSPVSTVPAVVSRLIAVTRNDRSIWKYPPGCDDPRRRDPGRSIFLETIWTPVYTVPPKFGEDRLRFGLTC